MEEGLLAGERARAVTRRTLTCPVTSSGALLSLLSHRGRSMPDGTRRDAFDLFHL